MMIRVRRAAWGPVASVAVLMGLAPCGVAQTCSNEWATMFPGDGGLDGTVRAVAVFDAGLYVAGAFQQCMGRDVWYVSRWTGRRWAGVGAGLYCSPVSASVYALVAFDDPNTPEEAALYAGAVDGVYCGPHDPDDPNECWRLVAATDAPVRALAVYQGALYAAGEFTCIRTSDPNNPWVPCDPDDPNQAGYHIARWLGPGSAWEVVGIGDPNDPNTLGMDGPVLALTVFDDGGGEALFAGGTFLHAGGVPASRVARWKNGSWSALGSGIEAPADAAINALAGWNGRLYVGGKITQAGGVPVRGIAAAVRDANDAWTWSTCGSGVFLGSGNPGSVTTLAALNVGGAEALYAGGNFVYVGSDPNDANTRSAAKRIAKWDGAAWLALSDGFNNPPYALATYNDGHGAAVYAGGGASGWRTA